MKSLKLIGLAVVAAFICPALTSCSDDDDDDKGSNGGSNATQAATLKSNSTAKAS